MLTGPDVSRHQGTVDFEAVRRAGHAFAIIKGTDGTRYSYIGWFHANFPKVRAAGLVPGVYHFLRSGDGAAQARYFVAEVNRVGGFAGALAVVDVESNVDGTEPTINTVRGFATEFRRLTGGHPLIVYTGRWFWVGHMHDPHGADLGVLWHSEYETSQAEVNDGPESDRYGGWSGATFWQWTSSGSCPGVSGRVDLNLFYGSHQALAALAGSTTAPPPQEDDMPDIKIYDCTTRPALLFGAGPVRRLGKTQRDALRSRGIDAEVVDAATSDAIWSLAETAPVVDVNEAAIAAAVAGQVTPALIAALPPELTDHLTVDDVEATLRAVLEGVYAAAAAAASD